MIILYSLAGLYLLFYFTWLFYVAFMHLKEHKDQVKGKLGIIWKGLYPFFIVGLLLDVLFNFIIGTIYFLELPREWLFTSRCQRLLKSKGTKLRKANFMCNYLLDPFDKGHCS